MNPRLTVVSLIALFAHTPVSARPAAHIRPIAPSAAAHDEPRRAHVAIDDLDLTRTAGAEALRRRIDDAVIALSGGTERRYRPEVRAARATGRAQADALIAAARS